MRKVEPPAGGAPLVIPPPIAMVFGGYAWSTGSAQRKILALNSVRFNHAGINAEYYEQNQADRKTYSPAE